MYDLDAVCSVDSMVIQKSSGRNLGLRGSRARVCCSSLD